MNRALNYPAPLAPSILFRWAVTRFWNKVSPRCLLHIYSLCPRFASGNDTSISQEVLPVLDTKQTNKPLRSSLLLQRCFWLDYGACIKCESCINISLQHWGRVMSGLYKQRREYQQCIPPVGRSTEAAELFT